MFNSKKNQLFSHFEKKEQTSVKSPFVKAGMKKGAETQSGNGALKYKTTGNAFVDQFGKLGSYKAERSFAEISADCETLWAINPLTTVVFMFYIRMITRVVQLFNGVSTTAAQRGAQLKHEGIMRMIWLSQKAPTTFWKNIGLFVSVGSWKDVIVMLQYDLVYNGWEGRVLDWEKFSGLLLSGLQNKGTCELIKKYLPQIKANKKCTTVESQADNMIAKWICAHLFGGKESSYNYKQYRQLKSNGTAHQWQQLISQGKHDLIDFSKIHGRALNLLVRGKYLKNQKLVDKYSAWVKSPETKEVKYTGFVHELFGKLPRTLVQLPAHEQDTINKQFDTLVTKGRTEDHQTRLIVVRDTSASMGSASIGNGISCYNTAKALALYFSEFLTGAFSGSWIEFNSKAQMHQWSGNTPLEKWYNDHSSFVGSTDFLSVIQLFVQIKHSGVAEADFPTGILCISDGEFNPASQLSETNVNATLAMLKMAGFSEEYVSNFTIVLWNLQSRAYGKGTGEKFETYGNVPNVFYFSGYEPSVIAFLTSKIRTAEELFNEAMSQEVLSMIEM